MKKLLTLSAFALLLISSWTLGGCSSSKKGTGAGGDGTLSEADLNAQREDRFGAGSIPRAEGSGMFKDIPFDFDSATVSPDAHTVIESNAEILKQNDSLRIVIEGHCDERGTAEYNMALGAKRAKSVQQLLTSLGVASSRMETISYGEEVPLDPAHDEAAWAKNRRAHLSPYAKSK